MALTVKQFPDIKYVLGISGRLQEYVFQPGSSDYPTGGYPVTAAALELGELVGVTICGTNAAGAPYEAKVVFPAATFGTPPQPATSFNLLVTQGGIQAPNGTDLSACSWAATALGW